MNVSGVAMTKVAIDH